MDAELCVHNTAKGRLNRGYRVNVVKDAVTLQAEEKWDALMAEYEREGIRLTSGEKL